MTALNVMPLALFRKAGESTHDLEPVLDGKPIRDAVRWQEGSVGWVEVFAINADTNEVDRDFLDRPKTKRMNGVVTTRQIEY